MIESPWSFLLTVVFVGTGIFCLVTLVAGRLGPDTRRAPMSDAEVVHAGHGIMSVAMVAMVWVMSNDVVSWTQIAVFAILTLALIPTLARAQSARVRVEIVAHMTLNLAMIWMLWAMPLLMAGSMTHDAGGAHAGHEGHGAASGTTLTETPAWADVTNGAFVGLSIAATAVFAVSAVASKGHRTHAICHVAMGAGMAVMLVLMN
ncbi:MAG: DUF5134 domain-containing protein [Pseudoclavibacter sp.]